MDRSGGAVPAGGKLLFRKSDACIYRLHHILSLFLGAKSQRIVWVIDGLARGWCSKIPDAGRKSETGCNRCEVLHIGAICECRAFIYLTKRHTECIYSIRNQRFANIIPAGRSIPLSLLITYPRSSYRELLIVLAK